MRLEFEFDPNIRTAGNNTFVTFDDWVGDGEMPAVQLLDEITLIEPESGVRARGFASDIDADRGIVFVDVDWSSLYHPDDDAVRSGRAVRHLGEHTYVLVTESHDSRIQFRSTFGDLAYGVGAGILHPMLVDHIRTDLGGPWAGTTSHFGDQAYRTVATTR